MVRDSSRNLFFSNTSLFSESPLKLLDKLSKFSTNDVCEARSYLSGLLWAHSLTRMGDNDGIDFNHRMAEVGSEVTLHAFSYGQEMAKSGEASDDSYSFVFTFEGQIAIEGSGYELVSTAGSVCVMNPRQLFRSRLSADHEQLTFKVSASLIEECFESAFGCRPSSRIEFLPSPVDIRGQVGGLGNIVRTLCVEMNRERPPVAQNSVSYHMERVLAGMLLEELGHNHTALLQRRSGLISPRYVKSAQDYIHAHARENIVLQQVAEHCNVSMRVLQLGFRKYLNATPIEYLRNVRLDLAHEELQKGLPANTTITGVALNCGFSSPSKFSEYYRERFGCSPSDVHRRSVKRIP